MLIEFAVTNFRSIKERQSISMLPSDRVKAENRKNPLFQIPGYKDLEVLTLAALWGKNSAGKSNIIKAFYGLHWLVRRSHNFTQGDFLDANEYFLFDLGFESRPTIFEIDFVGADQKRYAYLVEFTRLEIRREELYLYVVGATGKTNRRKLYVRQSGQPMSFGDEFKGLKKPIEERTRPNVLFLSKSIGENNSFLEPVFSFFRNGLRIDDFAEGYENYQGYFTKVATDPASQDMEKLNTALRDIDTGILYLKITKTDILPKNIKMVEVPDEDMNEEQRTKRDELVDMLKTEIKAVHRMFNGSEEIGLFEDFPLGEESEGTQKFIAVFSALLSLLKTGKLIIVDEFEKSFHPHLTKTLLSLLINPKINTHGTQIIFTTHDNSLMDILDNDQINLVQKDFTGATEIYTISDIRGLRSDIATSKRYTRGDFEGIPTINTAALYRSLEVVNEP
jgi:AAA15 family ATPase/GTPase